MEEVLQSLAALPAGAVLPGEPDLSALLALIREEAPSPADLALGALSMGA